MASPYTDQEFIDLRRLMEEPGSKLIMLSNVEFSPEQMAALAALTEFDIFVGRESKGRDFNWYGIARKEDHDLALAKIREWLDARGATDVAIHRTAVEPK